MKLTKQLAETLIEKAREQYAEEGVLEIDDLNGRKPSEVVSIVKDDPKGAYVQAWVWVEFEEGGAE